MKFKHDCEDCKFLGTITGPSFAGKGEQAYDLHYCKNTELGGLVIARYSSQGSHYASSPISLLHKDSHPALIWAWKLLEYCGERHGYSPSH